ncbi:DUF4167 domain-containing protein [Roseovarius arcticus]|uniref:DUF4167 domain-containing protein n=1 Tax=Roseovarius arcticus TaxID=2547404 RepID=UPI001110BD84|nr:DUF4167 domain-containing protein [Roseovarius arcticus]
MRSSKSRSRNKSNRNRPNTVGNVVNRVFDSSGPEGKVRGTPQQIIEKYNQLARDAQLSNDRVATENFQQHAEHYLRLLGEAQKEMDAKREQQERENRDRQVDRDRAQQNDDRSQQGNGGHDAGGSSQPDVQDTHSHSEASTLVETPEGDSAPKQRTPRKPRHKPQPEGETQTGGPSDNGPQDSQPEQAKPRPRRPRKPKADPSQADQQQTERSEGDNGNSETAAE